MQKRLHIYQLIFLIALSCFSPRLYPQCISAFPFTEGFESGPTWTVAGTASDWAWGTPAHPSINTAGGGAKSWCIGGLTGSFYNLGELSTLSSPCFNFSSLSYPWISLKIYWECEFKWDGLVLQSSIDNGVTWQNVGAFGDPTDCNTANWYTYGNITNLTSLPAAMRQGWTGRVGPTSGNCAGGNGSGGWVTAMHCLTGLANKPNVRFRFLFGSGTTCNNYDGIAIDDIHISNGLSNTSSFSVTCLGSGTFSFSAANGSCTTTPVYAWNFGDPASGLTNTSAMQNLSHIFSAPGTYTVRLIVSGGQCNPPDTSYRVITVANSAVTSGVTDVSCFGLANGSATVSVTGAGPCTYTWMPGGGHASVAANLPAGNYSVSIQDAGNCTYSKSLTINQPAPLIATVTPNNSGCAMNNGSATVTASGGTAPYTYSWSPVSGAGNTLSNLSPGNYSVTVSDANNCSATYSTGIFAATSLSVQVSNLQLCKGQNGVLTSSVTGGVSPYTYAWNGNPGGPTFAVNNTAGSYTLVVTDKNGCASQPGIAAVSVLPPLSLSLPPVDSVCPGPVVLNAGAGGGNGNYTYQWLPQNSSAPSLSLNASVPQSFTLIVSDGCTTPNVQVTGLLYLYNMPTSILKADKTSGCAPLCITLSDPVPDPSLVQSWSWSFGDNAVPSASPYHCYAKPGTYSVGVSYVTTNGCSGSQMISNYINVYAAPLAEFNVSTLETDVYNSTVDFYNYSENASSFQWYLANGAGISSEKNFSYAFVDEGTYAVFMVAKNEQGCADTAAKVIKIEPAFSFYAPDTFTPNSDNLNDRFQPVGTGWDVSTFDLRIFDRWGEMIFHTNRFDEGWDGKLKGVLVENGIYVWKVLLKDVQAKRHEFVGHLTLMK